jgi:hypothetical protein
MSTSRQFRRDFLEGQIVVLVEVGATDLLARCFPCPMSYAALTHSERTAR